MEMTPLWKSAQDADSHSGLEKPRQERSAFPHFHRPDDEIKSTEKNFRKYFCRTSRIQLGKSAGPISVSTRAWDAGPDQW